MFTPPLCEHVPLPELELYEPLLHSLPAEAGAMESKEPARAPIAIDASILFFILLPLFGTRCELLYLLDVYGVGLVPAKRRKFEPFPARPSFCLR